MQKKPKISIKTWIVAVTCCVVVGILAIAFSQWQRNNRDPNTPDIPPVGPTVTASPSVTTPEPGTEQTTPEPVIEETTPEPPVFDRRLLGAWLSVTDDDINWEIAFNENGEFYMMFYDPYDLNRLELAYVVVLEGTYRIEGDILYTSNHWRTVFDYDFYEVVQLAEDDETFTEYSITGNTLTLYDVMMNCTKTEPILWDFGYREKMQSNQPVFFRMATLGHFMVEYVEDPDRSKGWITYNMPIDNVSSHLTMQDFLHRYLILEFSKEPAGEFTFVWLTVHGGPVPTENLKAQGNKLIIDMTRLNGYSSFEQYTRMMFFINYYNDSWYDLPLVDAYFAESPSPS